MIWLLLGCASEPIEHTFLEGFSYRWAAFNHRVSTLHVDVDEAGAEVAVIGGTSTTGVPPELDASCDASTCQEFPFLDRSDVVVRAATVAANTGSLRVGVADVAIEAGATPVTTDVLVPVVGGGTPVAVLQAFELDTHHPLDIESCYNPAFGWLPTHVAVKLGDPVEGPDGYTVPVTASFEAGNTLEVERGCVDASREHAVVWYRLRVAVALTRGDVDALPVSFAQAWELGESASNPDEQSEPTAAERPLSSPFPDAIFGWSGLDYRFHLDDPTRRGAYLRSLAFMADPEAGLLTAHATNYSPPTQLSGFDYDFVGTVAAFTVPGATITARAASANLDTSLDAAGEPALHAVGW
jgi:hypothetical protein